MKLSNETVEKLANIINVANTIGIEGIIIDKESIRGQGEEGAIMIIEKDNIPVLDFDAIGISRVKVLNARLSLITKENKTLPNIEAKIKEKDSGEKQAFSLQMKDKRTTIEFKCIDPAYIKAAKNLRSEFMYSFTIDEETLEFMAKSNAALSHNNIALELHDGKILFRLTDKEGDGLTYTVSESCIIHDGGAETFFFKFKKRLLSLLKAGITLNHDDKITVNITQRGVLNLKINGMNVYMVQDI